MDKKKKNEEGESLGSHSQLLSNGKLFSDEQLTEEDSKKGSVLRRKPIVNKSFYENQEG